MPGMDHLLTKAFLATGGAVAYKQFQCVKQVAESTLQPAQCAIMTAGDTNPPLGVVQEPLDAAKTVTGKAFVGVALSGNTKVIVGATANIAIGKFVIPSATVAGAVDALAGIVGASAGTQVVGKIIGVLGNSINQAVTAGDLIDIELLPGHVVYLT
jgi:hypothetical protein